MYNICKTLKSVFHKNKNERISDTRGWHPSTIPFGCFKFDCAMLLSLILSLLKERKWELFFFRTIFTVVNLLYNSDTILIQRALKKKKIPEYFRLLNRTLHSWFRSKLFDGFHRTLRCWFSKTRYYILPTCL